MTKALPDFRISLTSCSFKNTAASLETRITAAKNGRKSLECLHTEPVAQ